MARKFVIRYNQETFEVSLNLQKNTIEINGKKQDIKYLNNHVQIDDQIIDLEDVIKLSDNTFRVHLDCYTLDFEIEDLLLGALTESKESDGRVTSPMAGVITKVLTKVGDKIKVGTPLLILSAMKMENEVKSPVNGVIKQIRVNAEDSVNPHDLLIEIATD